MVYANVMAGCRSKVLVVGRALSTRLDRVFEQSLFASELT